MITDINKDIFVSKFNFDYKLSRNNSKPTYLPKFIKWSWNILIACSVIQGIFFLTLPNLFAIFCVFVAWLLTTKIFFRYSILSSFPLTSLLVIGFTVTQFYFPLVFTLAEGKPIVFNLVLPYQVFLHSIVTLFILAITHAIYREYFSKTNRVIKSILKKAKFFQPPSEIQLWIMGYIGLFAMAYSYFVLSALDDTAGVGTLGKFIQGLIPFAYAPYFFFVSRMYGKEREIRKGLIPKILFYTVLIFVVSVGGNVRSAFMLGFTSLGFAFALSLLLGIYKTRLLTVKNVIIGTIVFLIFTGPVADLGTAMLIVRAQKSQISRSKLIALTLEAYGDKKAIAQKRGEMKQIRLSSNSKLEWDEYYLDNIFLAKFCNLKFNDATLVQAAKVGEHDESVNKFAIDLIWSELPTPILTFFQIKIDKNKVNNSSFGDYLYYRASGDDSVLGGHRSGSLAGTSMAAFGLWYFLYLAIGMIPVFILYDSFFIKSKNPTLADKSVIFNFSVCSLLALTAIFEFLPSESVIITLVFIMRGFFQMVFLYYLMFQFSRIISGLLKFN